MDSSPGQVKEPNCIGGGGGSVMISMRTLSVVDYKIDDCFCHLIQPHNIEFTYLKMFHKNLMPSSL